MKISMDENNIMTVTENVIKEIVAKDDEHTKQIISDYAMKKSAEIGEKIHVKFIDKEIVDKIINLGIIEYMKKQRIAKDNIERLKRSEKRNGKSI